MTDINEKQRQKRERGAASRIKGPFKKAAGELSEAERALTSWGIDYERKPDGSLLVPGDLNIPRKGLTELPDLSSVSVGGRFNCHDNQLTSLKGAPCSVGSDFDCDKNRLASLEHAPVTVGGDFSCDNNQLTSLKGAPQTVGGSFSCDSNELASLEGGPRTVSDRYTCDNNRLTSLEGAPQTVGNDFSCDNNRLTALAGAPRIVGDDFSCAGNQLTTLEGGPRTVGGAFTCVDNQLADLDGAPATFQILRSDLGEFSSWNAVPGHLRISPETIARRELEQKTATETFVRHATVLQAAVTVRSPLQFRRPAAR